MSVWLGILSRDCSAYRQSCDVASLNSHFKVKRELQEVKHNIIELHCPFHLTPTSCLSKVVVIPIEIRKVFQITKELKFARILETSNAEIRCKLSSIFLIK